MIKPRFAPFQKSENSRMNFKTSSASDLRFFVLPALLAFIFLILIVRLFQLIVVKGSYYRFLAEKNRIREVGIEAEAGTIRDRKGFTITYSQPIGKGDQKIRIYNHGEAFAHLIGYRQLASREDIKNDLCDKKLTIGDKVGKTGVEAVFGCILRGARGKKVIEVNSQGKFKKTITVIAPRQGQDIKLAVDMDLQLKAHELIKDKKAAIVASKPDTGEILILDSTPSYDPQAFENNYNDQMSDYFKSDDKPLFDRAVAGLYPPGSVFKLFVAAAALREGAIDLNFKVEDTGIIKAGPLTFGNWYFLQYGKTEGEVDIIKAIMRSNDIFFYKVGEKLGPEKIRLWADKFGFGQKTNINLPEEEGLIPSEFWKKDSLKDNWYLGDTYNLSIGQGYLLVTPLQINLATAAIANDGHLCKPLLLKDQSPQCKNLNIGQKNIDLIKEGMKQACETGGTGWPFFDSPIKVGCKTGTAESHKKDALPHAWFTIFAPYENPEIVLTVMVEESGEGSNIAAPIAKEILKAYFERSE